MSYPTSEAIERLQTLQQALEQLDERIAHVQQHVKLSRTTFDVALPTYSNASFPVDINTVLHMLRTERARSVEAVTEQATEVARLTGVLPDALPPLQFSDDAPF